MLKLGHLLLPSITMQGGGRMQSTTTIIDNAGMLALATTPLEVVAAPIAGSFIRLLSSSIIVDATAGVYVEPSTPDDMAIRYTDGSGLIVSETIVAIGLVTTADIMLAQIEPIADAIVTDLASLAQNLVLDNTGTDYTGGNAANTVKVVVNYMVIKA